MFRVVHRAVSIITHESGSPFTEVFSMHIIPQNYIPYHKFLTSNILYSSISYYLDRAFNQALYDF